VNRREFITLLGGAAAAWPLAVWAQQSERMRRIGVLMTLAADDPEAPTRIGAFLQGVAARSRQAFDEHGGHWIPQCSGRPHNCDVLSWVGA
jgi:hypothetical protein